MTNDEARDFIREHWDVSRETLDKLDSLAALVIDETQRQNLISKSTVDSIWFRHILDSLQLYNFAPSTGRWLDIGSGAGFPGLVIAIFRTAPMVLIEPRRLRASFLESAVDRLDLPHVTVVGSRVETVEPGTYSVISARAFAALTDTIRVAHRFATADTAWILPKGRTAHEELAAARESWQGDFRLERSLTDHEAKIVVANRISAKGKR